MLASLLRPRSASRSLARAITDVTSKASFEELTSAKGPPALVFYTAAWCKPCRDVAPHVKALGDRLEGLDLRVLRVDVEELGALAGEQGIKAVPFFEFHRDGEGIGPSWTLVGDDGNNKVLVPQPLQELLQPNETAAMEQYDQLFERYSMYCNGRWLGAQVLQDAQDLMYMQHIVYAVRPALIIETGTYKGGLTYFFASLLSLLRLEASRVLSIDRNPPEAVFGAKWFCPVCEECVRPWETEPWQRHVEFLQGWADQKDLYAVVRQEAAAIDGPVMVNLDACHEHDCVFVEIVLYARLVSVGSYLVVQDAKLDKLWDKPAVTAAVERFLRMSADFELDHSVAYYGYSQHAYLRRVADTLGEYDLAGVDASRVTL